MTVTAGGMPGVQAAGVYQWTDAQGHVHFDDRNVLEQQLTIGIINAHRIPAQPEAGAARIADSVRQQCDALSERMKDFRSARRLEGRDPDGNAYVMSERQVLIEIATLEREHRRTCAARATAPSAAGPAKAAAESVSRH